MKWCWSRLAGGVVTWEAYELFRIGEQGRTKPNYLWELADLSCRLGDGPRRFRYLHTNQR